MAQAVTLSEISDIFGMPINTTRAMVSNKTEMKNNEIK
jgi:hypothetical protein